MATQAKGQHGPGKEKRGTSPSYLRHTDATTSSRRSPSAPSPSRPPDKKQTPLTTTTTSEKRTPNYLKPTVSSSPNPSTQGKTQTSSHNTAQKPNLNRRRSFDKPPSPNSLLLKSHTMVNPREKTVVRSSSNIMPKTSSSFAKPHQDKFLKAHKDAGKFHALSSVSKKTTPVKKQNVDATTSTATVPTKDSATSLPDLTADSAPLVECHKKDQESSVTDVEEEREVLSGESKIELPPHVSPLDDDQKEDIEPDTGGNSQVTVAEKVKNQNEEIKTFEPSSVIENQNESLDVHMEGVEDGEEILEETRKDESHESHQEEIVDGDDEEGEESATENSKDKSVEEEEEVGEGNLTDSKGREKVDDTVTEAKTHMENTAGKQQRQGKETQAYNDVIEETASKLRQERKNKVKALAGAFETVISLQKPEA